MTEEIFRDIFEFEEIVLIRNKERKKIIQALMQLKAKAEKFNNSNAKDK